MRKIAYISGGLGPLSSSMERVQKFLRSAASPGTAIDLYSGMGSLESRVGTYEPHPRHPLESEYDLLNYFPYEVSKFIDLGLTHSKLTYPTPEKLAKGP